MFVIKFTQIRLMIQIQFIRINKVQFNQMIRKISKDIFSFLHIRTQRAHYSHNHYKQCPYQFSSKKNPFPMTDIPKDNLEVRVSSIPLGEEFIQLSKTKGALSILNSPSETKTESGQLYALNFKCTKCKKQAIRSFTKQAYQQGVVIVQCKECENVHLVADNLGWFEVNIANIVESSSAGLTKRYDQVAIVKFIKKAFEQDKFRQNSETKPQGSDDRRQGP